MSPGANQAGRWGALDNYHPAVAYHLDQVREKENDDGKGAAIWIRTKKKRRSGVKHNSLENPGGHCDIATHFRLGSWLSRRWGKQMKGLTLALSPTAREAFSTILWFALKAGLSQAGLRYRFCLMNTFLESIRECKYMCHILCGQIICNILWHQFLYSVFYYELLHISWNTKK